MTIRSYHHFEIQEVASGVWAAVATPMGSAGCNAGIVDLGGQTVVWDTFVTVSAARELRAAAEALTGRPAAYVINSHSHPDHIQGNVVFAHDAVLLCSQRTRQTLEQEGLRRLAGMRRQVEGDYERLLERIAATTDEAERSTLQSTVKDYEAFFAGYPGPEDLRIPAVTYERTLNLHGAARHARVSTFGGAHATCDSVLWLPGEGVLFTGDLVIPGGTMILSEGGDPDQWLPILDRMEALGARTLVPGHGPVTEAAEGYAHARRFLTDLFRVADEALAAGETPEFADRAEVPEGAFPYWYRRGLRTVMERRSSTARTV